MYESMSGKIAAVLLDMTMPVMNGQDALTRLHARWPKAVVIATSGYDQQEAQRQFGAGVAGFIQKPYTAGTLRETVNSVLLSMDEHGQEKPV